MKNLKKAQIVNFDLCIGDPITPGPKKILIPSLISQNEDISWSVYPIETIIAERLHALIAHGDVNSRSKDVYDLSIFLAKADVAILKEALARCFKYCKTEFPKSFSDDLKKLDTTRLERGWASAIASLPNAPKFKMAFESVVKIISGMEKSF